MPDDELSCDIDKFHGQLKDRKRIAVTFIGKDFPASESYINALGEAYEEGFFGDMELAVIPVYSQQCDQLAEHEGVEVMPRTCIYNHGEPVGCVTPSDEDAENHYKKTIEALIDLSEE